MSSDIARGMMRRLQEDRDRMDFIEHERVSVRRLSDLVSSQSGKPWVVVPYDRSYTVIANGRTARAAIDNAMKAKVKP